MKVELQGTYGGDKTHALSAWTSTDRELTGAKLLRIPELLSYLASEGHYTPFEKSAIHILIRCDTASHIHILKHRIGVSVNGESARYKQIDPSFHAPDDWPLYWQNKLEAHCMTSKYLYHEALADLEATLGRKRAKESARYFLPFATETTLDVQFNFKSFMHFCNLRYADDAQREIQKVSEAILHHVKDTNQFNASLAAFGYNL